MLTLRDLNRATLARQYLLKRHKGDVTDVVHALTGPTSTHSSSATPTAPGWSADAYRGQVTAKNLRFRAVYLVDGFTAGTLSLEVADGV
ncbi:hypothetical protein ACQEVF_41250 [Nonomuraea polychroma]|uniref:hypothetical protein n=1 Tax=Nonomuraea polychroma TaxID=46176 RepID=UPI003D8F36D8